MKDFRKHNFLIAYAPRNEKLQAYYQEVRDKIQATREKQGKPDLLARDLVFCLFVPNNLMIFYGKDAEKIQECTDLELLEGEVGFWMYNADPEILTELVNNKGYLAVSYTPPKDVLENFTYGEDQP